MKCSYRRFHDVFSTNGAPLDGGGILFTEDMDGLSRDPKFAILGLDSAFESAVNRVIFEHINLGNSSHE